MSRTVSRVISNRNKQVEVPTLSSFVYSVKKGDSLWRFCREGDPCPERIQKRSRDLRTEIGWTVGPSSSVREDPRVTRVSDDFGTLLIHHRCPSRTLVSVGPRRPEWPWFSFRGNFRFVDSLLVSKETRRVVLYSNGRRLSVYYCLLWRTVHRSTVRDKSLTHTRYSGTLLDPQFKIMVG